MLEGEQGGTLSRSTERMLRDKVPGPTYTRAAKQAEVASKRLPKIQEANTPKAQGLAERQQPSLSDAVGDSAT
jgi:hypothetical protein